MPRIPALKREDLSQFQPAFKQVEANMGFLPNLMLTMARHPRMLAAFGALCREVLIEGEVDLGLKQLIAYVSSNAVGCRYCQAHTAAHADAKGVEIEKIESALVFEDSPLFSDAEKAALAIARSASLVPCEATDAQFEEARKHYTEEQILEIVAVISLFGFANRWTDALATELESVPGAFGQAHLAKSGWDIGPHKG